LRGYILVGTLSVSDVRMIDSAVALGALAGPQLVNVHAMVSLFAPSAWSVSKSVQKSDFLEELPK
jgi:hypothetical protein